MAELTPAEALDELFTLAVNSTLTNDAKEVERLRDTLAAAVEDAELWGRMRDGPGYLESGYGQKRIWRYVAYEGASEWHEDPRDAVRESLSAARTPAPGGAPMNASPTPQAEFDYTTDHGDSIAACRADNGDAHFEIAVKGGGYAAFNLAQADWRRLLACLSTPAHGERS
jgi:hypothetical protein